MSVISKTRSAWFGTLLASALCGGALCSALPACGARGPSTVAQGKYYASGDPHYDEFFIGLYLLQVEMGEAPRVPEVERRNLAQTLKLAPDAPAAEIGRQLRERALELSHAGVHLYLEQNASSDKPQAASALLRSNALPKENPAAALLSQVETSSTNLLRSSSEMKEGEEALGRLEQLTITLDAGVEQAFAQAHFGKQGEVKTNLADAHKLITLMRARAEEVKVRSEQLLAEVSKAVNTDDGSLGSPEHEEAAGDGPASDAKGQDAKKAGNKPSAPHVVKAKAASTTPTPTVHAKPATATASPAAAPVKAPAKAAPAARDFEP